MDGNIDMRTKVKRLFISRFQPPLLNPKGPLYFAGPYGSCMGTLWALSVHYKPTTWTLWEKSAGVPEACGLQALRPGTCGPDKAQDAPPKFSDKTDSSLLSLSPEFRV